MKRYSLFPTPLGECGLAWCDDVVIGSVLPEATRADTAARIAARTGASLGKPPDWITGVIDAIGALLRGEPADLASVRCDFGQLDAFSVDVLTVTRGIPPGATRTYGEIATELGDVALARGVGRALGRNPIPIIVPCHRVIGADGSLTGFSAPGGVATKLRILAIEGAQVARQQGLFDPPDQMPRP